VVARAQTSWRTGLGRGGGSASRQKLDEDALPGCRARGGFDVGEDGARGFELELDEEGALAAASLLDVATVARTGTEASWG
jgi:hypothetical protein